MNNERYNLLSTNKRERGATIVEYVILLALLSIIAFPSIRSTGKRVRSNTALTACAIDQNFFQVCSLYYTPNSFSCVTDQAQICDWHFNSTNLRCDIVISPLGNSFCRAYGY